MPQTRSALPFLAAVLLLLASPASASHPRSSSGSHHSSRSYSGHSHSNGTRHYSTHSRSYTHSPSHHYSTPGSAGSHRSYSTHRTHSYRSHSGHTRRYAYSVPRDSHGRIKRSEAAKRKFERQSGYPHGRPGYVVDHIIPLSKGGRDDPSNMQWQTKEEAKAKDRTEGRR